MIDLIAFCYQDQHDEHLLRKIYTTVSCKEDNLFNKYMGGQQSQKFRSSICWCSAGEEDEQRYDITGLQVPFEIISESGSSGSSARLLPEHHSLIRRTEVKPVAGKLHSNNADAVAILISDHQNIIFSLKTSAINLIFYGTNTAVLSSGIGSFLSDSMVISKIGFSE